MPAMIVFHTAILLLLLQTIAAAPPSPQLCDVITQYQQKNPSIRFQCSGTVVVLDGCTFMVRDFTFGGALQTQWYAGIVTIDPATSSVTTSDDAVRFAVEDVAPINNLNSSTYSLVRDPSSGYSWSSINQLRVFDLGNQQVVCVANMPNGNPFVTGTPVTVPFGTAPTASRGLPVTTTVAVGASGTAGARSGAEKVGAGILGVFGVVGVIFGMF
ncbi:hypothetical protein BC829DRAFT_383760 [Chytridium lagenaria]|nr:hypothetical protein BC829DRAFT_383760 [Chytridium lagenaria]